MSSVTAIGRGYIVIPKVIGFSSNDLPLKARLNLKRGGFSFLTTVFHLLQSLFAVRPALSPSSNAQNYSHGTSSIQTRYNKPTLQLPPQYMLLLTALLLHEYLIPFLIYRQLPEPSLPMTLRQQNPIIRSFKFLRNFQKPVYGLP
jgi:hypothetical protein